MRQIRAAFQLLIAVETALRDTRLKSTWAYNSPQATGGLPSPTPIPARASLARIGRSASRSFPVTEVAPDSRGRCPLYPHHWALQIDGVAPGPLRREGCTTGEQAGSYSDTGPASLPDAVPGAARVLENTSHTLIY